MRGAQESRGLGDGYKRQMLGDGLVPLLGDELGTSVGNEL